MHKLRCIEHVFQRQVGYYSLKTDKPDSAPTPVASSRFVKNCGVPPKARLIHIYWLSYNTDQCWASDKLLSRQNSKKYAALCNRYLVSLEENINFKILVFVNFSLQVT